MNTVLMIEPVAFGFNEETSANNYFQQNDNSSPETVQRDALNEFNTLVETLTTEGVNVITVKDTLEPRTPDSIFPNNWVSFHGTTAVLYPMFAPNRRNERRKDIFDALKSRNITVDTIKDYSACEKQNIFLEGTGSMVLDRERKIACAAVSERTNRELFMRFCSDFDFVPLAFTANQTVDGKRLPIYHTNVMMCIADKYAVICLDSIDDAFEKDAVIASIETSGKKIIPISEEQMHCFAGNMLQLDNAKGEKLLTMSRSAYESLNGKQLSDLLSYNKIVASAIPTIEKYGGGSVRCMIAEVRE